MAIIANEGAIAADRKRVDDIEDWAFRRPRMKNMEPEYDELIDRIKARVDGRKKADNVCSRCKGIGIVGGFVCTVCGGE